jgi:hypothetical protein
MAAYAQPATTSIAGQTWTRGGRTVRILELVFQSSLPTVDITVTEVPVLDGLQKPVEALPAGTGRLVPPRPGASPAIGAERAVMLASFYWGTEASNIVRTLAYLDAPGTSADGPVWVLVFEPCSGCQTTRDVTAVLDATNGHQVEWFVGHGKRAKLQA